MADEKDETAIDDPGAPPSPDANVVDDPGPPPAAKAPETVSVPEGMESTLPQDAPRIRLPVFEGFDKSRFTNVANDCADLPLCRTQRTRRRSSWR